ncbi:hypothetical protein DRE_04808 [Drechslerella stenobrocha 248]|uniref:Uncharacterized protein n=1 Tax=Drechslerella stenobrocha 248 TaxID=1043628 RepID=W7IAF0_9PEZI|nr:hypothetical protein DRE_04808 [Drechslerella stenobrocha 248]
MYTYTPNPRLNLEAEEPQHRFELVIFDGEDDEDERTDDGMETEYTEDGEKICGSEPESPSGSAFSTPSSSDDGGESGGGEQSRPSFFSRLMGAARSALTASADFLQRSRDFVVDRFRMSRDFVVDCFQVLKDCVVDISRHLIYELEAAMSTVKHALAHMFCDSKGKWD